MYSHSYRKMTSRSDCPTVASVLTDTLTYILTFFLTSYLLVTSDLTYTVFIPFDFLFFILTTLYLTYVLTFYLA